MDLDDRFRVEFGGGLENRLGHVLGIENRLGASFTIAKIDEKDTAEVAATMDPAGQGHFHSGVLWPEFIAVMRARHVENRAWIMLWTGGFAKGSLRGMQRIARDAGAVSAFGTCGDGVGSGRNRS